MRIVLFSLFLLCCSPAKKSTQQQTQAYNLDRCVIFGSGGGFTGLITGYKIDAHGKVSGWSQTLNAERIEKPLYKASDDSARMLFATIDSIHFKTILFDQPGNYSRFITLVEGDSVYTVTWSNISPPAGVMKLDELLQKFIPQTEKR